MAQVTSDFIWYPSGYPGPAYDMRKVVHWVEDYRDATKVSVRFVGDPVAVVSFPKADFEVAMQTSLDAGG